MNVTDVIDTIENEDGDYRILTADSGLQKLFSDLYSADKVIKLPVLFASVKFLIKDYINFILYKKKILNECLRLKPKVIIFYYIGWNGFESFLIKKLSAIADVYYRPKVDTSFLEDNNSLKISIKSYIFSAIYGIKFKPGFWYGYPIIVIDDYFLKQIKAKKYPHAFDPLNIKKFILTKFKQANDIKVLLLTGGEYNLDRDEYQRVMNSVYDILIKYYKPSEIGITNHPNFPTVNFEWEETCVLIDKKTPANLLCYAAEIVIAYGSSVLYEVADVGLNAISTAYIIPSTSDGQAATTAQYLLDNSESKNISFPKDIEEFNELLIDQLEMSA